MSDGACRVCGAADHDGCPMCEAVSGICLQCEQAAIVDAVVAAAHRALVEECCAGAEVGHLPMMRDGYPPPPMAGPPVPGPIPIAHVGSCAGLAEPVAVELAQRPLCYSQRCHDLGGRAVHGECSDYCGMPPFAAAVIEAGGVRTFVLASDRCGRCGGYGKLGQNAYDTCPDCSGVGIRTDCRAIADLYQPDRPWRDDDTPRLARFTMKT